MLSHLFKFPFASSMSLEYLEALDFAGNFIKPTRLG